MLFKDLENINSNIAAELSKHNINEMTDVQAKTYKHIYNNKDLIVCSGTGTGKTLAYLCPIISRLSDTTKNIQAIILVPNGELASQINKQLEDIFSYDNCPYSSMFVTGEGNINRQLEALKHKPAILVGTPARVYQLINIKKLKVHEVKTIVLDEADKLLGKTYIEHVYSIRKSLMKYTQVLLFSASIDKKTRKEANSLTYKAIDININAIKNSESVIPSSIKHNYVITDRRERIETLRKLVKAVKPVKCIIFINTKYDLEEALQKLQYHNYNVGCISGNQDAMSKRNTLNNFKSGKLQLLLATDIAARGLQIDNIDVVINVNLPEEPKEYIHRAGRCGRNGNKGLVLSIITENELNKILKGDTSKKIGDVADKLISVSTTLDSSLSTYTKEIKPQLDKTVDSLLDVLFDVSNLLTTIENQSPQLNTLVKSLNGSIEAGDDLLTSLHSLISNCAKQLENLSKKLDGLGDSEIVNTLMNLTEGNSDELGSFIACPVKVNTDKIYGIDNYGSAMAPFYSTLALWVGAIILVALIKPKVANKKEIGNIKPREEYFGRSLIFLTISLVQGLIICLGDLYFLKIQCYHPVKFIFAGLCASFVFTFFIYSLVAAWGDIGKAVAVILLVVQLGGCGGTFPIDVTPAFFRAINPYLPYTFVIDALRECVCGTYGNNYWICLGKLFVYFFIGLLIGTLFRYLFRKPMRFFEKKVEETGLL